MMVRRLCRAIARRIGLAIATLIIRPALRLRRLGRPIAPRFLPWLDAAVALVRPLRSPGLGAPIGFAARLDPSLAALRPVPFESCLVAAGPGLTRVVTTLIGALVPVVGADARRAELVETHPSVPVAVEF